MAKRSHNKFIKAKSGKKTNKPPACSLCERKWSGNKKTRPFSFIFHIKCDGPSQRWVSICPSRDVVWLSSFYFTIDQITIFLRSCWIHSPWSLVCAHFYKYLIFLRIGCNTKLPHPTPFVLVAQTKRAMCCDLCVCGRKKLCMRTWVLTKLHDDDEER